MAWRNSTQCYPSLAERGNENTYFSQVEIEPRIRRIYSRTLVILRLAYVYMLIYFLSNYDEVYIIYLILTILDFLFNSALLSLLLSLCF